MLDYKELGSNKPKELVILLHGYGSNMNDLISLAPELSTYLPDAKFISVNAPLPFEGDPSGDGRQWFSLREYDEDVMYSGAAEASIQLDGFVSAMLEKNQLKHKKIAFVGFSQGAMLSMHYAYRMKQQIAGVICYSGILLKPESLQEEIVNRPPVLLIHGLEDYVLPEEYAHKSFAALRNAKVESEYITRPYLAHGIDSFGINAGGQFLRRVLSVEV